MASRGFLIRFIDIGLIVLFGFLMISDIEMSSRVELAGVTQEEQEPTVDEDERAFLVVEVTAEGGFRVTDSSTDAGEPRLATTTDGLVDALRDGRAAHRRSELQTVVLIQPHPASLVQYTVDAMDACDRLRLPKSLRMDIEVAAPDAPEDVVGP